MRASLVPAAAVIPALIVYANNAAIKKLIVEFFRYLILNGPIGLKRSRINLYIYSVGINFLIVI